MLERPVFNVYSPYECDKRIDGLLRKLENEEDVDVITKEIANASGGYFLFTDTLTDLLT